MALSFPNSPTDGQIFTDTATGNRWSWDSANTCWKSTSTFTQTITVASSAPGSPVVGQLWWNQDYGRLLVYYSDGTSSQWVDASPSDYTSAQAYNTANAAFGKANTALQNTSGTFAGDLTITGNVGIGISSPVACLSLGKMLSSPLSGTTQPYGVHIYPTTSGACYIDAITNSSSNAGPNLRAYNNTVYTTLIGTQDGGTTTTFGTAGTERMRIDGSSLHLTNLQGIKFQATQSASSDANTLDDYEEGTWTPTFTGLSSGTGSHTQQNGYYVKVGRNVTVWFIIRGSRGTCSGTLVVSGLPYTSFNGVMDYGYMIKVGATWGNWSTSPVFMYASNGNSYIGLWDSGTNFLASTALDASLTCILQGQLNYLSNT